MKTLCMNNALYCIMQLYVNREKIFDRSELIYLSPDGKEELMTIDPDKVYIIGGFVDRSVNKVG